MTGLLLGVAYGYAAQRGAFCMNSGFRAAVTQADFTKVKALLLAVAIQAIGVPALVTAGLTQPVLPAFDPVGAMIGGLAFGAAMGTAGGCAAGAWYKLGAGSGAALVAFVGIALGASLPLAREGISLPAVPAWATVVFGAAILVGLARAAPGRAGAWPWQRTGLAIAAIGLAAWVGRDFGLAMIPGVLDLSRGSILSWDALFVLGIPAGAWMAARRDGPVRLKMPPARDLVVPLLGGVALGASARIAGGCTVGHGLAGLALLAPQSVLAMVAIYAGSAIATLWRQERSRGRGPSGERATSCE